MIGTHYSSREGTFIHSSNHNTTGNATAAPPRKHRTLVRVVIALCVAAFVECTLFNLNFWQTINNEPVELLDTPTVIQSKDDTITISNLDVAANNITIRFSSEQSDNPVYATYTITDEGMSVPYDLPEVEMLPSNELSCTQSLYPYGNLRSITVSFIGGTKVNQDSGEVLDENTYPIYIESVTVNTRTPFSFNPLRFALLLGLFAFIALFRPKSFLYQRKHDDQAPSSRATRVACVVSPIVVACAIVISFPGWSQVSTSFYNSGDWDQTSLINLTEPSWYHNFAYDEYTELAKAFAQGNLYIAETPPSWLAEVENPYDLGTQESMSIATNYWYKTDAAYYNGHYYVYFGVVPVLLMYLPFYLLTGADLPSAFALLIAVAAYLAGLYVLLRALVRRSFPHVSLGAFLLVYLCAAMCSVLIVGLSRPTLYQVPVACARAFAVWGLYFLFEGWKRSRVSCLAIASLCLALIAGCRPQLLFFALPLVIAFVAVLRGKGSMPRAKAVLALVVPCAIVAAGLMWYNAARFGSPLDFGAMHNLAGNDMARRGFVAERLIDGLFGFLLQPPVITTVFPFLQIADSSTSYQGITIVEPLCGGLFATLPFLWAIVRMGPLRHTRPRVFAAVIALFASGIAVCCFDVEAAGMCGRYYQDFAPFFALAAALVVLARCNSAQEAPLAPTEVVSAQVTHERILLFAAAFACFIFMLLQYLCFQDNASCNTGGGSWPVIWEYLRQTFAFWL